MTRTERLASLLLYLQSRRNGTSTRVTAGEIAQHFGISRRTVLRDMAALSVMGVPLESWDGVSGGYTLPPDFTLAPLPLTHREALLLLVALGGLEKLAVVPFGDTRETLARKLRAMLSPAQRAVADSWLDKLSVDVPERLGHSAPFLDTLLNAAHKGGWLVTRYRSESGGEATHTILSRHVSTSGGFWYCRAWSHERQAERTFRVDRFNTVEACAAPPGAAQPAAQSVPYDHPSHPDVRVRLTAAGTTLAERDPHASGAIRRHDDGSGEMIFRCPPSELDYWGRFFYSMGANAFVEAPDDLRDRIREQAEKIAGLYPER